MINIYCSLKLMRAKVWKLRTESPLFNVKSYTQSLEQLYARMWHQYTTIGAADHLVNPTIIPPSAAAHTYQSSSQTTTTVPTATAAAAATASDNQTSSSSSVVSAPVSAVPMTGLSDTNNTAATADTTRTV